MNSYLSSDGSGPARFVSFSPPFLRSMFCELLSPPPFCKSLTKVIPRFSRLVLFSPPQFEIPSPTQAPPGAARLDQVLPVVVLNQCRKLTSFFCTQWMARATDVHGPPPPFSQLFTPAGLHHSSPLVSRCVIQPPNMPSTQLCPSSPWGRGFGVLFPLTFVLLALFPTLTLPQDFFLDPPSFNA